MPDTVPVANYRTRIEAEVAARILEAAQIPCVINSAEGMFHGPLLPGTTVLVRAEHAAMAREVLHGEQERGFRDAVRVASYPSLEQAEAAVAELLGYGIPSLVQPVHGLAGEIHEIYVRRAFGRRARRLLQPRPRHDA